MKNKFLFAVLFLALNLNLDAQEYNKQYSVKATALLESKLEINSAPYQVTVKTLGEKSNKRFSAGLNLITSYTDRFAASVNLNLRFGKERFIDFGKNEKWRLFYGLDFPVGLQSSASSPWALGTLNAGIAPFAGLQFRINERLVLHTETNYELSVSAFAGSRRTRRASLFNRFRGPGSIWLGFELFKPKKRNS